MGSIRSPKILDTEERWRKEAEDEYLWWPRILWIDPGVVSGVACIWFDPKALLGGKTLRRSVLAWHETYLYGSENGDNGQVSRFLRMSRILAQETGLAIGVERFTVMRIERSAAYLSPVRIRAAIEHQISVSRVGPKEILVQSPGDAMTAFTDDRLRSLEMYTPGPDHIRDGTRHCLLHLRRMASIGREAFQQIHGHEDGWWE